jgi:D-alanyl-D-alanine carboxypeptidase/D-alanyl-D-alanine-endopeptidase (penicillin-binding protein 4)
VTGEVKGGVLEGDLVVRGGGDPKLTYERLWQAAHQLRSRGVREIRGDILLDRSYFSPVVHDAAGFDNQPRRAYNVGPDPLLVNFNAVDFRFIPGENAVRVTGEPDLPNVEIASRIKLTREGCGDWRHRLQYDVEQNGLTALVMFTGTYAADCGERTWPLAIFDGTRYFESAFRWLWSESGGVLRGKLRMEPTPANARLIYRHESEPLAGLVRDMNKFSNNVMARHVFLALSAERGAPGETGASARILREWLAAKGLDERELVVENGSGLSRNERASAAFIASVLRSAWASGVMPELASSFPVFAVDGTLRTRRAGTAGGNAHLKGGTLTGVQSMAGYVLDRGGKRWIAVMIVNHANAGAAQPALDALVQWVSAR